MTLSLTQIALIFLALVALTLFGGFAFTSLHEKEYRAAQISGSFTLVCIVLFVSAVFFSPTYQSWLLGITAAVCLFCFILFLLPIGKSHFNPGIPQGRCDERDVIFSRSTLQESSQRYIDYYLSHPDQAQKDTIWRHNPGLLSPAAEYADPFAFSAANASFATLPYLAAMAEGPFASSKVVLEPTQASLKIKNLARFYGAKTVGICRLKPEYIYSHSGRGAAPYGREITLTHQFAIAMTFEMNHAMIGANPQPPGIMETGREYVESAKAAVQLAGAIRNLGYSATAHFEGYYQVIIPPIARDAGLGEIGRMSLLITPNQGPRVRLAVVTTELPLIPARVKPESTVIDFCSICRKCAQNCPSKAIPFDEPSIKNGTRRWCIDPDACFSVWTQTGTDCGRCMTVCPYAHTNNFPHNLIRWGIRTSGFFRRAALLMDDLFYGKYPKHRPIPSWTRVDN